MAIIGGHSSLLLGGLLQPPGNPFHDNPCTFSSVREKSAQHILHDRSAETVAHTVALAVLADKTDMLRALLSYGMSPDTQDSEGQTPLMLAVYLDKPEATRVLLERRADLYKRNHQQMSAVDLEAKKKGGKTSSRTQPYIALALRQQRR